MAQLPQFTLLYLGFSCQEGSLGAVEDGADTGPIWDWGQKELHLMPLQHDPLKLLSQSPTTYFLSMPVLQGVLLMLPNACGSCCGINPPK